MNDVDDLDALAENTLRRALRLDAGERPPRLDAAVIVALAEHRTPLERLLRAIRGSALVGVSVGIEALVAVAAFNLLADLDLTQPFGLALSVLAVIAERVVAFGALTASPSVALAALAAVIFATLYERSTGRESINVRAS